VIIQEFASVDDYAKAVAAHADDACGEVDPLVRWGVDLYEVWKSDWQDEKSLEDAFRFFVVSKVLGYIPMKRGCSSYSGTRTHWPISPLCEPCTNRSSGRTWCPSANQDTE
jgi:hypothetical protein